MKSPKEMEQLIIKLKAEVASLKKMLLEKGIPANMMQAFNGT